jgi:hypothetical protein
MSIESSFRRGCVNLSAVMRGLDPRIHHLAKRMDCRVKPGNDDRFRTCKRSMLY